MFSQHLPRIRRPKNDMQIQANSRLRIRGYAGQLCFPDDYPGAKAFPKSGARKRSPRNFITCLQTPRLFEDRLGREERLCMPWFRAIHLTLAVEAARQTVRIPVIGVFVRRFTWPRFCPLDRRSSCPLKSTSHTHGRLSLLRHAGLC